MNRRPSPLFVLALVTACGVESATIAPPRTGPEFTVAFPDPHELVTNRDVAAVRGVLDTVPLPRTKEHHDRLRQLLAAQSSIDTEHLLLLTEAVALPGRTSEDLTQSGSYSIITINDRVIVRTRGQGEFCGVVDELLLEGAPKLTDPGARNLGRLLDATQGDATVAALCEQLRDGWDDGSPGDLGAILDEVRRDSVRQMLCVDILLPNGRLDEARADLALSKMSFDSSRTALIEADYARRQTVPFDTLLIAVRAMSFDAGRRDAVAAGAPRLGTIDGRQALDLVSTASFDSGRLEILDHTVAHVRLRDFDEVLALVDTASFDSGRRETLEKLLTTEFPKMNGRDLVTLVETASFDSDRTKLVELTEAKVEGRLATAEAKRLLETFSFGAGRTSAIRLLADHLRDVPPADRESLLDTFSFDSEKDAVREMLGW